MSPRARIALKARIGRYRPFGNHDTQSVGGILTALKNLYSIMVHIVVTTCRTFQATAVVLLAVKRWDRQTLLGRCSIVEKHFFTLLWLPADCGRLEGAVFRYLLISRAYHACARPRLGARRAFQGAA